MQANSLTVTWMVIVVTLAQLCMCIDQCPAAEEGKPYSLQCNIPRLNRHWMLYWILVTDDGKQKILFSCDGNKTSCKDVGGHHSDSANASINKDYSTLDISNVTHTQRDAIYTCRVTDETKGSKPSLDIMTCSMSLYYLPTNPVCHTETVDTYVLRVSCITAKVYPSVTCELWERFNLDKTKPQNATFKYQKELLTDSAVEYYSVQCSVDVFIDHPGSYQFLVFTTPDVKYKKFTYSEKRGDFTEDKIVSDDSAVELKQSDVGCKDLEFQCKATFFTNRPKLRWYVGDEEVRDSEMQSDKVSKGDKNYYTSVSKLVLKKLVEYDGKFLKCVVSTSTSQKENQTRIIIKSWPPGHPPVFKDTSGASLGLAFDINEHDNVTLVCEIKGGEPKISSTRVQCWDSNSDDPVIDVKSKEDSVSFTIFGSENFQRRRCKCSGEHSTTCYNATETITFGHVPVNGSARELRSLDTSRSDHIYIIVGVTAGCIFLICIFAAFMMFRRHWHDLYYSVYNYFLPPPRRRDSESLSEHSNPPYLNVPPPVDRSRKPREAVNEWLLRNETQNNPRCTGNQLTTRPPPIKPRPHRSQGHITVPSSRSLHALKTPYNRSEREQTSLKTPYTGSEGEETSLKTPYTRSEQEETLQRPYGKSSTSLDSGGYLKIYPDVPESSRTLVQVHPNYRGARKQSAP